VIATIGVLGGGQLGRMLTLEAKRMGYRVVTLEPFPNSPCGQVADEQLVAAYDDLRAIGELGARSDVVTYEFENIPLASVTALESDGRLVRPNGAVLRITQDRLLEKDFIRSCGCPTAEFAPVRDRAELAAAIERIGFPAVMKTTLGGYDGKGQWTVHDRAAAEAAFEAARGHALIYEQLIPFEREVSVICARNAPGDAIAFPVTENIHDRGVLATTIVPARVPDQTAARVETVATLLGERLGIVGAYCVEFFVRGASIYVNEIAPRVHNSGHYSLDATQISQYEAHVRAICDLPLVPPRMFDCAVMMNILGTGAGDHLVGVHDLLLDPDLKLHMYGKAHAALRRKMGHFTVLAHTVDEGLRRAEAGRAKLSWAREPAPPRARELAGGGLL
jgi:5-(carboxyamino)imidazole ribonucleotide synthase